MNLLQRIFFWFCTTIFVSFVPKCTKIRVFYTQKDLKACSFPFSLFLFLFLFSSEVIFLLLLLKFCLKFLSLCVPSLLLYTFALAPSLTLALARFYSLSYSHACSCAHACDHYGYWSDICMWVCVCVGVSVGVYVRKAWICVMSVCLGNIWWGIECTCAA